MNRSVWWRLLFPGLAMSLGWGLRGQETYAQTVGFVSQAPWNLPLGYLGLTIKGALWGLLGGAAIGIAFRRERLSLRDIAIGAALMIAATWLGWMLVHAKPLLGSAFVVEVIFTGMAVALTWMALQARAPQTPIRKGASGAVQQEPMPDSRT